MVQIVCTGNSGIAMDGAGVRQSKSCVVNVCGRVKLILNNCHINQVNIRY